MRLRVGGSDSSASSYTRAIFLVRTTGSTGEHNSGTGQTAFRVTSNFAAQPNGISGLDIFRPNLANHTAVNMISQFSDGTSFAALYGSQSFAANTVFDGFSIFASAGTITGKISVYGYKD